MIGRCANRSNVLQEKINGVRLKKKKKAGLAGCVVGTLDAMEGGCWK